MNEVCYLCNEPADDFLVGESTGGNRLAFFLSANIGNSLRNSAHSRGSLPKHQRPVMHKHIVDGGNFDFGGVVHGVRFGKSNGAFAITPAIASAIHAGAAPPASRLAESAPPLCSLLACPLRR